MTDPARAAGRQALDALERALAQKPVRDGEAFSAATDSLCRMRDGLGKAGSGGAGSDKDEHLPEVNAVISAVLAGHFPLGSTPWPQVESAVATLRRLVAEP